MARRYDLAKTSDRRPRAPRWQALQGTGLAGSERPRRTNGSPFPPRAKAPGQAGGRTPWRCRGLAHHSASPLARVLVQMRRRRRPQAIAGGLGGPGSQCQAFAPRAVGQASPKSGALSAIGRPRLSRCALRRSSCATRARKKAMTPPDARPPSRRSVGQRPARGWTHRGPLAALRQRGHSADREGAPCRRCASPRAGGSSPRRTAHRGSASASAHSRPWMAPVAVQEGQEARGTGVLLQALFQPSPATPGGERGSFSEQRGDGSRRADKRARSQPLAAAGAGLEQMRLLPPSFAEPCA